MCQQPNHFNNLSITNHDLIASIFGLIKATRSVSLEEMQEAISDYPVEKFDKITSLTNDLKITSSFNSAKKFEKINLSKS